MADLEQGGGPAAMEDATSPAAAAAMEEATSPAAAAVASTEERRGGDLVMLTEKAQLQTLAALLRNNEEPLMRQVLNSEQERAEYIRTVNDSYRHTMQLLDDCTALKDTHGGARSGVARDVHSYVVYGLNLCMQNIRNCCVRVDAIGKLRSHYDALAARLADPGADVGSLAAEAAEYKASMWEYSYKHRSASGRAASRAYSQVLKLEGVDFPELLRRHQVKLGYGGKGQDFEDLEDSEKLDVYNSVIGESGRAQILFPEARGKGGKAVAVTTWAQAVSVFIMAAGNMVWDIYTAEHNLETVLSASLRVLSAVGAFAVEVAVTGAVTKAVASVGLGVFACSLAGFVVGAVAGLIFIVASGKLVDLIFGSGSRVPEVTELKFHTAVMPDGMAFANAIAH